MVYLLLCAASERLTFRVCCLYSYFVHDLWSICSECTMDGSEFPWCAVEVDAAGRLVDKRWGKCDMSTCAQPSAAGQEAGQEDPRTLLLTFPTLSGNFFYTDSMCHRLNRKLDLQSLFGLHVTWCAQLFSLTETPLSPPPPIIWAHIRGALLVS